MNSNGDRRANPNGQSIYKHLQAFTSIIPPIKPFNYVYFFKIMIAMLSNHNKLIAGPVERAPRASSLDARWIIVWFHKPDKLTKWSCRLQVNFQLIICNCWHTSTQVHPKGQRIDLIDKTLITKKSTLHERLSSFGAFGNSDWKFV